MDAAISKNELRRFGIVVGAFFIAVFALALPWIWGRPYPRWPFYAGSPLILLGLIVPAWLRPLHFLWMKLAEGLGWINTRIILAILFFLIFTPLALIRRLLGKDPLGLRREESATYWRQAAPDSKPRFDRPF
ncbi:MAG TPA: SxtJ family membrane protein [bacterium]|nr:SxtJ family membrane protein [bacterium]